MNVNENLKQICKEQKKSINFWNREINNRLSMNTLSLNKKGLEVPLFIIDKDWLEKYESLISDTDNIDTNLYNNFEGINNSQFSNLNLERNLIVFEKIYFLDEKTWNSMFINKENEKMAQTMRFKGSFYDKILIIELIREKNYKMYCLFFYLDHEKEKLMQGFLKINNLEKEKDILNIFKCNKLDFIKECYNILDEKFFKCSCFELFIFESNNNLKKIDKKTILMNDMFKDINKNEKVQEQEQEQKMMSYLKSRVQEPPQPVIMEEIKYSPKVTVENKENETVSRSPIHPQKKISNLIKSENQNILIKSGLNNNNFINPVIQCFNNLSRLREELINNITLYNNKNKKLSLELVEVLKNMKYIRNKCSKNLFLSLNKVINEMNPSIKEPKDLILFILETVDEELNLQNNNIESLGAESYVQQLEVLIISEIIILKANYR